MKSLITALIVLVVCTVQTQAQEERKGKDRASAEEQMDAWIQELQTELKLTDEQAETIKKATIKHKKDMRNQKKVIKISESTIKNAKSIMKMSKQEYDDTMKATLSEEQYTQMREKKKAGKGERKEQREE